jgi:hypothetical protein
MNSFHWRTVAQKEVDFFREMALRIQELEKVSHSDPTIALIHAAVYQAYSVSHPRLEEYVRACQQVDQSPQGFDRFQRVFRVLKMHTDRPKLQFSLELRKQIKALAQKIQSLTRSEVEKTTPYLEWLCSVIVTLDEPESQEENSKPNGPGLLGMTAAAGLGWFAKSEISKLGWFGGKA